MASSTGLYWRFCAGCDTIFASFSSRLFSIILLHVGISLHQ